MGNKPDKYDLTSENLNTCEREVLNLSGMHPSEIISTDVKCGEFNGQNVTVRTFICGSNDKPKLVFTHGYGGSGALMFKTIKPLCEYF